MEKPLTLTAKSPFSLASVISSHGWVQLLPFFSTDGNDLFYTDRLSTGRVAAWTVWEAPGGVRVEIEDGLSRAERDEIAARVRWVLGLDQDFSEFYELARTEPRLARMQERAQGRVLRSPTLFEDTVKTILTTNTSWSGTIRMVEALVALFGEALASNPDRRAFPTPEQLAQTDEETLRGKARLGYRAPHILGLARAVAGGELDLEVLKTNDLPSLELRKQLLAIKGVGRYAAANLLLILGRYDFLPVDSWAMTLVSREWHAGQPVNEAQVEAAFADWGEWKGLAYWFWDWTHNSAGAEEAFI